MGCEIKEKKVVFFLDLPIEDPNPDERPRDPLACWKSCSKISEGFPEKEEEKPGNPPPAKGLPPPGKPEPPVGPPASACNEMDLDFFLE